MEGYIEELRKQAIGGVIKYIKLGNLTEALIELPSVDEQKSIVEILEKAKGILDKRNDEICALDYLIKARFVEMFGNFVYERDRWNVSEIGDVADTIDPQPSHRTPPISPDGIPYVGIAECNYRTRRMILRKREKLGRMCCENIQNVMHWTKAISLSGKLAPLESLSLYLQNKTMHFRLTQC